MYLSVGLTNPTLPGLQYDEAADAVPAVEMITGRPLTSLSTINLFGRQWPLMMLHHIGPTSIFTSYAGLSLFGISVEALRVTQLIVGAVALLLLWWLARRWFDDLTAGIAVLLCGTAPAFIWWSRAGANWTVPLLPLSLGLLLALRRWWQTRRPAWLILAGLLFGIGFTTKILFIWLAAPIALTALALLGPRRLWTTIRSVAPLTWLATLVAVLVGLSPFILHNLPNGDTFRFIFGNAAQTRLYGHNNLDFVNNLGIVVGEFVRVMGGDTLHFLAPAGLPLGGLAFVVSILYLGARSIAERRLIPLPAGGPAARDARLRLFLLLCIIVILPLSTVSTSSIGATYLFILVPLAWLSVAVAIRDGIAWLCQMAPPWRGVSAGIAVAGVIVAAQTATNLQILQHFSLTGGKALWSDAVYPLAQTLDQHYSDRPIHALDWGFSRNVAFLTHGQVRIREIYEFLPSPSPAFADMAQVLLQDQRSVYVAHAPGQAAFQGYLDVFERQARKMHKQIRVEHTFTERDGTPNTLLLTAGDEPRNFVVSPTLATRNALFAGTLALLGGEVDYDSGQHEVAVRLYWQSLADSLPDDTVLLHIVNQSTGEVVMIADQQPLYGNYAFSKWMKNEVVTDYRWVALPADLPGGVYQVRVGVYNTATGERRPIQDPLNDAAGNSLMLKSFEVR